MSHTDEEYSAAVLFLLFIFIFLIAAAFCIFLPESTKTRVKYVLVREDGRVLNSELVQNARAARVI